MMLGWAGATAAFACFLLAVRLLRLVPASRQLLELVGDSLSTMADRELSDDDKERAMQRHAGQLARALLKWSAGMAAALGSPLGLLWLVELSGLAIWSPTRSVLTSVGFVSLSSCAMLAGYLLLARRSASSRAESAHTTSLPEQLLHRLAFASTPAQLVLAKLEDWIFARKLASCDAERPVFVTGLPRAGTTLLLECCARSPELAAHCYRDMPFLFAPLLWARLSSPFRKAGEKRERAHGDGMLIDFDSPEAFEEALWATFWRKPYQADRIRPATPDSDHPRFEAYFKQHLRKLVWLRRGTARNARYISKNNLNVSRLGLLRRWFPEAIIVVPFRHPLEHARSLLRQHRNFSAMHAADPFTAEYMRHIGHFDFGANLRPVDFDGWLDGAKRREPTTLAFWLDYWTATYKHVLTEHRHHVSLLDYDAFAANPSQGLLALGALLELEDPAALLEGAPEIAPRARASREVDREAQSSLAEALALYDLLQGASVRFAPPRSELVLRADVDAAARLAPGSQATRVGLGVERR